MATVDSDNDLVISEYEFTTLVNATITKHMPLYIQRIIRYDMYKTFIFDDQMVAVLFKEFQALGCPGDFCNVTLIDPFCAQYLEDMKRGWKPESKQDGCTIPIAERILAYERDNMPAFDDIPWFLNASLSRALICYADKPPKDGARDGNLTAAEFWTSFLGDANGDDMVTERELVNLYKELAKVGFRPMGTGDENSDDADYLLLNPDKYGTACSGGDGDDECGLPNWDTTDYYLPGGDVATECYESSGPFLDEDEEVPLPVWFLAGLPPSAFILSILNATNTGLLLTFSRASAVFEPDLVSSM